MPTARRKRPSVAPVDIVGTTGMLPHIFVVRSVTAESNSGSTLLGAAPNFSVDGIVYVTLMPVSPTMRPSAALTSSAFDVGTIRQLILAVAVCGSALYAWPP